MLYLNATNDISRPLPLFIFKERGCKVMHVMGLTELQENFMKCPTLSWAASQLTFRSSRMESMNPW